MPWTVGSTRRRRGRGSPACGCPRLGARHPTCWYYVTINASLVGQILHAHGRPDVVETWIGRLLRGEILPSIALTEPGGGSDAAALSLAARRAGDDYVLTGEKTSISFATRAAVSVVFARTGPPAARARGISAFLVPTDAPGLSRTAFDDVRVPASPPQRERPGADIFRRDPDRLGRTPNPRPLPGVVPRCPARRRGRPPCPAPPLFRRSAR
jgi:hypothetical protein